MGLVLVLIWRIMIGYVNMIMSLRLGVPILNGKHGQFGASILKRRIYTNP
jgi:hypothetical protein